MSEMMIDFYDETIKISIPDTFQKLKEQLATEYCIDHTDVDELIISYKENEHKINVKNESDYKKSLGYFKSELFRSKNKNKCMTDVYKLYIEVSEKSKLYQKEFENTKSLENTGDNEKSEGIHGDGDKKDNCKSAYSSEQTKSEVQKYQDQLRLEILEKEKQLKDLLEKEREERERRLRVKIEKEKREQEEKIRLQKEEERIEREEQQRKEKELLKDSLNKTISDIVNSNLDQIKSELINKTVLETSKVLENSIIHPNIQKIPNLTVHRRVKCDGCGMFPIVGIRYKCTICSNFDFCEKCEEANGEAHNHPFIKYRTNPWESKRGPCGLFRNWNQEKNHDDHGYGNSHDRGHPGQKFRHRYHQNDNHQPHGNFFSILKDKFIDIFSNSKVENKDMNTNTCEFINKDKINLDNENEVKEYVADSKTNSNSNQIKHEECEGDYLEPESGTMYETKLDEIRAMYDLSHISDERIIQALNQTGGEIIPALMLLF